jgi:hypothetical protein
MKVLEISGERFGDQVVRIRSKLRATQRAHRMMRKRVAQELRPEMGRMGAEDPPMSLRQPHQ